MSYTIYHTEGIVLGYRNSREADRVVKIFTRELGLVVAQVQGARKLSSKHRYGLQLFSRSKISLIRGKSMWRVTGVIPIQTFSGSETMSGRIMMRAYRLALRMLQGEVPEPSVYNQIVTLADFVTKHGNSILDPKALEIVVIARVLSELGYWDTTGDGAWIIQEQLSPGLVARVSQWTVPAVSLINESLHDSQL